MAWAIAWSIRMRRDRSFRWRITIAFALLASAVCVFFALTVVVSFQTIEHHLFGQRLQAEAEWLAQRAAGTNTIELPPGRHFYQDTTIPTALRRLSPGYHDLEEDNTNYHVAVTQQAGHHFLLVSDESDFEHLESLLYLALLIGGLTGLAVSIWLGRLTAGRIIAPLTELADAVQRRHEDDRLPGLASEDEIGALARAFAARSVELRGYLQRERLFTGDVSHELRTPLTVVLGASELISAQAPDNPVVLAAADRIRRATQDMTERVGAFLLLSRAPETLDAPTIPLLPLITRELERCQPLLAGKPVVCILDAPREVNVQARPELVAIAIGNLIRNACQYTDEGEVRIRLDDTHLSVEDTGPGLPETVQNRLFERFVRGSEERIGGSGLGFAIVKRVADHLGWGIRFETPLGGGSRFVVTFPSTQAPYL